MIQRTTIVLDDESNEALEQLTRQYGWSRSETIRRAVVQMRDRASGVPEARRRQRVAALETLIELTDGNNPGEEIAQRKAEDQLG
jgi:predicted transcriptional regulator